MSGIKPSSKKTAAVMWKWERKTATWKPLFFQQRKNVCERTRRQYERLVTEWWRSDSSLRWGSGYGAGRNGIPLESCMVHKWSPYIFASVRHKKLVSHSEHMVKNSKGNTWKVYSFFSNWPHSSPLVYASAVWSFLEDDHGFSQFMRWQKLWWDE